MSEPGASVNDSLQSTPSDHLTGGLSLSIDPSALACKDLRHLERLGSHVRIIGFSDREDPDLGDLWPAWADWTLTPFFTLTRPSRIGHLASAEQSGCWSTDSCAP